MGYRHYFYKCKKADIAQIREKSLAELAEYAKEKGAELYLHDDSFLPKEEVFEFGKLYYEDTAEQIYKTGRPLFEKAEVMKEFEDYVPYEVGKEGLLKAIDIYQQKIKNYYENLLKDGDTRVLPFGIEIPMPEITSADK